MAAPQIEALGVYSLVVTEDLLREQFDVLYGYEMSDEQRAQAERQCRDQLSSVVLIELLVKDRDSRFSSSDFTQAREGEPRDNWQVAWAEAYLRPDGNALLVKRWNEPPEFGDLRVVFFMHFWDETEPLLTSYGEVICPRVSEMPDRLKTLVPYIPVD